MKKPLILLCLSGILFFSCSKKTTTPEPNFTNFKITGITIQQMPEYNSTGAVWDYFVLPNASVYPDVYFTLSTGGNSVLQSTTTDNVKQTDLPLATNLANAFNITNLNTVYTLSLNDQDFGTSENMGSIVFKLDDYKSGFPASISLTGSGCSVIISGSWF